MIKTGKSIENVISQINEHFDSKQNSLSAGSGIAITENSEISLKVGDGLFLTPEGYLQNTLLNGVEWNFYEYTCKEETNKVSFDLPAPCIDKLGLYVFLEGKTAIPMELITLSNKGFTITIEQDDNFSVDTIFTCRWTSYSSLQPQLFLFSTMRSDYIINDIAWLRAEPFSWHSGDLYQRAYKHLLEDYESSEEVLTETIRGIEIQYKKAVDGHKICSSDQNDNIQALYELTEIAWYYIIDTENKRFKLPRSKYNMVGVSTQVGDYKSETIFEPAEGTEKELNKSTQSYLYFYMGRYEELQTKITSGAGRNIGDIFFTSRLDSSLNGAVEANGATYNVEEFVDGENSVVNLLRNGSLPSVSVEEYESIVSTNGSCRAWGWDNGDTFRVPLLKDVYLMAGQAESAGEFISESLPNITGKLTSSDGYAQFNWVSSASGAFSTETHDTTYSINQSTSSRSRKDVLNFNASSSSSAYQDGAKVRPDSVRYRAMVQLVNSISDKALISTTNVISDIANLKDASNLTKTGKSKISSLGMPGDRYVDLVLGASGTSYTAPANGYFYLGRAATAAGQFLDMFNTTSKYRLQGQAMTTGSYCLITIPARKGDVVEINYNLAGAIEGFCFIYAEGEE